jgi:phenylalanyl-tRNA synthetase beta chain
VRRDLAVIVDIGVSAASVRKDILVSGTPLVAEATLFDVYRGKGVPEGRKSLAFRVLLQDTEKTLTDADVEALIQTIIINLKQKQGATLRT